MHMSHNVCPVADWYVPVSTVSQLVHTRACDVFGVGGGGGSGGHVLRETTINTGHCWLVALFLLLIFFVLFVCVFITAGPSTKLCAWGGGGYWGTCATRDDEPRPVWTSLPIMH
jgi:hypothetical protein